MYSVKEKLRILREIHNPAAVQADLALFRTAFPDDSRLVKFNLMPERHAEEILFSLLDRFTREEIIANRRTYFNRHETYEERMARAEKLVEGTPEEKWVEILEKAGLTDIAKKVRLSLEEKALFEAKNAREKESDVESGGEAAEDDPEKQTMESGAESKESDVESGGEAADSKKKSARSKSTRA